MAGIENTLSCISEGSAFMSPVELRRMVNHPYKVFNPKTHGHFLPTEEVFPPYSLPARPFRWTMKKLSGSHDYFHGNPYNIHFDPTIERDFGFNTIWVQEAANQREIFNYFFHAVQPHQSLCLVYAKQVPFVEDSRRVIMGIGFVEKVNPAAEYRHDGNGSIRSLTWETMVEHSIREDRKNGFLFPYKELMAYAEMHPEFDIRTAAVFASEEYFSEFSYATEHLSHDAVIDVLLQTLKALNIIKNCLDGNWDDCIKWVNARLTEVWNDRGAFPGIGAMLCAAGFPFGILIAEEIKQQITPNSDIWSLLDMAIAHPSRYLSSEIAASISPLNQTTWIRLSPERKALFRLLSRFSLTYQQAQAYFLPENRQKIGLVCTDIDILTNPYTLYEQTRSCAEIYRLSVKTVDMAVFPPLDIRKQYPLPAPSALSSDNDPRRIRAYAIYLLEYQALCGHTIYPINHLILEMNDLPIEPGCNVTSDNFKSISSFLSNEITLFPMTSGEMAVQLIRLTQMDKVIITSIQKRVNSKNRHVISENWAAIVNREFGEFDSSDTQEFKARQEKSAVLKELAEARLSVLIGGAGTGKTTLLSLLCSSAHIKNGGILLLAPTGKARVRMSQAMADRGITADAQTAAQFLVQNHRFNTQTMQYVLSDIPSQNVPGTVIIDECSMLTEEMFGALLQALRSAQRIILIGDPNQLPPIGAGRPFVDLVNYLSKDLPAYLFPRVGKSFGELKITRRQKANANRKNRLDTELSKWYVSTNTHLDESVFERLQVNEDTEHVLFKQWSTPEELETILLETLSKELGMRSVDDQKAFDCHLGAKINGQWTYFNVGAATAAAQWQILSPVRGMRHGIINLNHLIHQKYRKAELELAKRERYRKIARPFGPENIVYGDKVINVSNEKRDGYPRENAINYVANGEIGIACGGFNNTDYLKVEYSSQPKISYSYSKKDFSEESDAKLELAYALTVHKAQGSEFDIVFLILSEPCHLISKELLYTAITRQTGKLVILYNGEAYQLRNYTSPASSDIARRFTNLFVTPNIVAVNDRYYEESLIHRTLRGEMVRSKSEVIIANELYRSNIPYAYEKELILDGVRKIPDFTIDDPESGDFIIWEHCGMMSNPQYRKRWEEKKKFYEMHGIIEGENLIVTYDDEFGGIDSSVITKHISEIISY